MEKEIKTTTAETHLETWVTCPYCDSYQNQFDPLREYYDRDELSAENIEAQIQCEDCKEKFIVTEIIY